MKDIRLAIGRKFFSFRCDDKDADKLSLLSFELNKMVNSNTVKYRGLSEDSVFLLTAFELLDTLKSKNPNVAIDDELLNGDSQSDDLDHVGERSDQKSGPAATRFVPEMHHPYPRVERGISNNMFGSDINNDAKLLDDLIFQQERINRTISSATSLIEKAVELAVGVDKK